MNIKTFGLLLFVLFSFSAFADSITILPITENTTIEIPELAPETPSESPIEAPIESPVVTVPQEPGLVRTALSLIVGKLKVFQGELLQIQAVLTRDQQPVADQEIRFYANTQRIGHEYTNEDGQAFFFWDTNPYTAGTYQIRAEYADETATSQVIIEEQNQITAQAIASEPSAVQEVQSCRNSTWMEEQTVMDTCTKEVTKKICSDEPLNQTCNDESRILEYECNPYTKTVQRTEQVCRDTALIVNNAVRINIEDYVCSTTEGSVVIVLCDSKFDGNGDGICKSGESCMRFTVDGSTITKEEKNSRDDFVSNDENYFLPEATAEVIG